MDLRSRLRRFFVGGLLVGQAGLVLACGGSAGPHATPKLPAVPVTFVYAIDGPDAGLGHATHLQLLDSANALIDDTTMSAAGTVDTTTVALSPGNYSAIAWDEQPASPSPVVSAKCGAPFTVHPGQVLVVTITNSRIGACLTDTAEPDAASSPSPAPSPSPASSAGPS